MRARRNGVARGVAAGDGDAAAQAGAGAGAAASRARVPSSGAPRKAWVPGPSAIETPAERRRGPRRRRPAASRAWTRSSTRIGLTRRRPRKTKSTHGVERAGDGPPAVSRRGRRAPTGRAPPRRGASGPRALPMRPHAAATPPSGDAGDDRERQRARGVRRRGGRATAPRPASAAVRSARATSGRADGPGNRGHGGERPRRLERRGRGAARGGERLDAVPAIGRGAILRGGERERDGREPGDPAGGAGR